MLETTSQTAYYFNFHVHDVGHFTVFGPTGSGKTVVLSFLMAQAMRIMPRPRCVYFDYMRGAEIFVRALGGRYEVMEPSQPVSYTHLDVYKRQTQARTPGATLRPRATSAAARRSLRRLLVQEPICLLYTSRCV